MAEPRRESDYVNHAISGAEQVLHEAKLEEGRTLAWTKGDAFLVIPGPFRDCRRFHYDLSEDRCFSVSSDDSLTPTDIVDHWDAVEKAELAEIQSFVDHRIAKLAKRSDSPNMVDRV